MLNLSKEAAVHCLILVKKVNVFPLTRSRAASLCIKREKWYKIQDDCSTPWTKARKVLFTDWKKVTVILCVLISI